MDFSNMIGKKLERVELSGDKEKVSFFYQGGGSRSFGVEGDCCSSSWIEHLEMPLDLLPATIVSVEDSDQVNATEDDALNPVIRPDEYMPREHECLLVYRTTFKTDRGEIALEYRNSSNGYYGGYLVDA